MTSTVIAKPIMNFSADFVNLFFSICKWISYSNQQNAFFIRKSFIGVVGSSLLTKSDLIVSELTIFDKWNFWDLGRTYNSLFAPCNGYVTAFVSSHRMFVPLQIFSNGLANMLVSVPVVPFLVSTYWKSAGPNSMKEPLPTTRQPWETK